MYLSLSIVPCLTRTPRPVHKSQKRFVPNTELERFLLKSIRGRMSTSPVQTSRARHYRHYLTSNVWCDTRRSGIVLPTNMKRNVCGWCHDQAWSVDVRTFHSSGLDTHLNFPFVSSPGLGSTPFVRGSPKRLFLSPDKRVTCVLAPDVDPIRQGPPQFVRGVPKHMLDSSQEGDVRALHNDRCPFESVQQDH